MELYHESFDFEGMLKHVDEVLASDGDKIKKFPHIPDLDEMGNLDMFIATCSVVYVKMGIINLSLNNLAKNKVVTFRQRENFQRIVTSIMREHPKCCDFMMHDDEIVCFVDTPFQSDVNVLFEQLAKINSMLSILSKKSQNAGLDPIRWGIGTHYGSVYVSAQRYHDGSPSYTWSGKTYIRSRQLSEKAFQNETRAVWTSEVFYNNLKDEYKALMRVEEGADYSANIINRLIQNWETENLDNKK